MSEETREPGTGDVEPEETTDVGLPDNGDAQEPSVEEPSVEEPPSEEPPAEQPAVDEPPAEPDMTGEIAAIHEALDEEEPAPDVEGYPPTDANSDYFTADPQIPAEDELGQTAVMEPVGQHGDAVPEGVDLGPAKRSNAWVWVGLAVGILIAAGAVGYAWWYTTSRPIAVPSVIGKLPAPAVQTINDAGLRLGKVSEIPTEGAPPGPS